MNNPESPTYKGNYVPANLDLAAINAQLRASEEQYRRLYESMMDAFVRVDMTGRIQESNQAYQTMLGYTEAELKQLNYSDLTPEKWHAFESKIVSDQIIPLGYSGVYEKEYRRKDGTIFPIELRTCLLRDTSGKPAGMWAIIRDITERKRVEKALRESEMLLREAQAIARLGSYVLDITTGSWSSSEELDKLFGITAAHEHSVETWTALLHPEDRVMMAAYFKDEVLGRGTPFNKEYRIIRHSDQTELWVHGLGRLECDAQGRPLKMIGTIQDITERKILEQKVARTATRLKTIVDTEPECVKIISPEGALLEMNPAGLRMLEATSLAQVQSKTLIEFVAPEYRAPFINLHKLVMQGKSATLEFEAIGLKGRRIWLETHATPLPDPQSGQTNLLGVTRDITARKQAEAERLKLAEQLTQAQKMESVGRLAGGVAHDFNNMLGVILGHSEMAMDQVEKSQPLYADLEEIRGAAQRSADLTRQLLAFGRKQTISPRVLDLNETVAGMLRMLRRLIGEDIDLVWQPDAGLCPVKLDPSQIDQILVNLCINARDAINGIGKLILETGNANFDKSYCAGTPEVSPGEYAVIAVSDTGCGMDKETVSHIFEPFFTTKDLGKGTGLGLATVYGIVKQNHGFINVYSEPGRGTTFRIYLPRHTGDATPVAAQKPESPAPRGTETILLVEDEPTMMKMTTVMLEKQGYTVLPANTSSEALHLTGELTDKISLLITDVVMPVMNGRDLANTLRQLCPNLKCLFISAYTANVIAQQGILEEGSQFIQKPFSRNDLALKVREVLDSR